jgi:hypothetical protein
MSNPDHEQDQALQRLPQLGPSARFDEHLRSVLANSDRKVASMPWGGRVLLFGSVALYLGWAINAASALVR